MRRFKQAFLTAAMLLCAGCPGVMPPGGSALDIELRSMLDAQGVEPITKPAVDPDKVSLGQALFFDKILSGNRNISCSTCHTPLAFTGDGLPLAIGEGGQGLSVSRSAPLDVLGDPIFIPRNSPDVFNRGALESIFWDGRVTLNADRTLSTPAGDGLLPGLNSALAAQAMFPVTSRAEMRGLPGDNDLADLSDDDLTSIWDGLMDRLLAIDEYRAMFASAFPDVQADDLTFVHAANAIAEFEIDHWTLADAPFDEYLRGRDDALSTSAKRGAVIFFGDGRCSVCHAGSMLTDEAFHNRAVPQLGPGKGDGADGLHDFGRFRVSGVEADRFCFRTPPLRNVAVTGPWMHSGVFATLEAAVRHELDPVASLTAYTTGAMRSDFATTYHADQTPEILASVVPDEVAPTVLSDDDVADLIRFIESLTSPSVGTLAARDTPDRVPSGLPLAD